MAKSKDPVPPGEAMSPSLRSLRNALLAAGYKLLASLPGRIEGTECVTVSDEVASVTFTLSPHRVEDVGPLVQPLDEDLGEEAALPLPEPAPAPRPKAERKPQSGRNRDTHKEKSGRAGRIRELEERAKEGKSLFDDADG